MREPVGELRRRGGVTTQGRFAQGLEDIIVIDEFLRRLFLLLGGVCFGQHD